MLKKKIPVFTIIVMLVILLFCIREAEQNMQSSIPVQAPADNVKTVLIDPGHGGEDGGAVGADGTLEKDINLSVALTLRDILTVFGFDVMMTRKEDIDLGDKSLQSVRERKVSDIKARSAMLETCESAVYIGVHQNHFEQASSWGTQVFYAESVADSMLLAQSIQQFTKEQLQPNNSRAVKPAGDNIYILYHANIPAVMVECGFLSNQNDLLLLNEASYRAQMAYCIGGGLLRYIRTERIE